MGFQASTYGMIFGHDVLNFFGKIEKLIIFIRIYRVIFSIGAQEQKICPNKLKTRDMG